MILLTPAQSEEAGIMARGRCVNTQFLNYLIDNKK